MMGFAAGCSSPEALPQVDVEVQSVGIDSVSHAPVVVLQERGGGRSLPIWVGAMEAQSIAMQVEGATAPRPLTHDLLKNVLDGVGAKLKHVLISDLQGGTYRARIFLQSADKEIDLDSRPSDAIALALRFKQPIRVATALLQESTPAAVRRQVAVSGSLKIEGITVQDLSPELAEMFSVSAGRGVLVADVDADLPDGLRRGDVILEVDHKSVYSVRELHAAMVAAKKDAPLRLSVQRGSDTVWISMKAPG